MVHANHVRHHHNLANYHHGHHQHRNTDDYDNDYFDNNVRSDSDNDDDEYYEYMNDLDNQQEEIAVGDFRSRDADFYDYGDNDREPDVSMLFDFMATGCNGHFAKWWVVTFLSCESHSKITSDLVQFECFTND